MVFSTQEFFLLTQELIHFTQEILPLLPKKLRAPYSRNLRVSPDYQALAYGPLLAEQYFRELLESYHGTEEHFRF